MDYVFLLTMLVPLTIGLYAINAAKNMLALLYCYFACKDNTRLLLVEKDKHICTYTDGKTVYKIAIGRTNGDRCVRARTNGRLLFCDSDYFTLIKFISWFVLLSYVCADMIVTLLNAYYATMK